MDITTSVAKMEENIEFMVHDLEEFTAPVDEEHQEASSEESMEKEPTTLVQEEDHSKEVDD